MHRCFSGGSKASGCGREGGTGRCEVFLAPKNAALSPGEHLIRERCLVNQITWAEMCAALALKARTGQIAADEVPTTLRRCEICHLSQDKLRRVA